MKCLRRVARGGRRATVRQERCKSGAGALGTLECCFEPIIGPSFLDYRHDEIDSAAITVVDNTTEPPAPVRVTPEQSLAERVPYDGVLVQLDGPAEVVGPSGNSWLISGWSGVAAIGTLTYDGPPITTGMRFASVTGPLQSKADADVMAIEPRTAADLPAAQ